MSLHTTYETHLGTKWRQFGTDHCDGTTTNNINNNGIPCLDNVF